MSFEQLRVRPWSGKNLCHAGVGCSTTPALDRTSSISQCIKVYPITVLSDKDNRRTLHCAQAEIFTD